MWLIKQSAISIIGRVLPALIGLGAVAIYTRLLDPVHVGAYALLISTSLLAGGLGYTWLRVGALRMACNDDTQTAPSFSTTIVWSFIATSAIIAAVEGAALHLYNPRLAWATVALTLAAAVSSGWYDICGSLLQSRVQIGSWSLLNFARAIVALAASLFLIASGFKTEALLGGFIVGSCTSLLFMGWCRHAARGSFDWHLFRTLFRFGWPLNVNAGLAQIYSTFQRYLLDLTVGGAAVGIYSVASDFSMQSLGVLIGSASIAGIPLAFKARDGGEPAALVRQLRENARLIFFVALPAAAGLAVLAGPISHVILGAKFRPHADLVIAIVAASTLASCLRTYYFDQAFELVLETRPQAIITAVGVAVVMGSSIFMIPHFGVVGAAWSALIGSVLGLVMSAAWGSRVVHMPIPYLSLLKTTAAVMGMTAAVILVPAPGGLFGVVAVILFGAIVYAGLSALTRYDMVKAQLQSRLAWRRR